MPSPPLPEVFVGAEPTPQPNLPLATEGVQRYVWQSRFGAILLEVCDGVARVNGEAVEPIEVTLGPGRPE